MRYAKAWISLGNRKISEGDIFRLEWPDGSVDTYTAYGDREPYTLVSIDDEWEREHEDSEVRDLESE